MNDDQKFFWLIGILEGEASFIFPGKTTACRITVQMKDKDIIDRIAEIWGTKVQFCHPPTWKAKGWSPGYKISLHGKKALKLMKEIKPYMSERRQERIDVLLNHGAGIRKPGIDFNEHKYERWKE